MSTPTDQAAGAAPFGSVDEVVDALAAQGYIADRRLATTVKEKKEHYKRKV